MARLLFLGTGGGRFATLFQRRRTGGLYIEEDGTRIHIDPGPGALVHLIARRLDPTKTGALLLSHCHADHVTDANILIDGMTSGGRRRSGLVFGSVSALEGVDGEAPSISRHHAQSVERASAVRPGEEFSVGPVKCAALPSAHNDPTTVGFRIGTAAGAVHYVADTALSPEVVSAHSGARVLVLPVTRPLGKRIAHHLCTEDAREFAAAVRPELVLMNHLGMRLLKEGPERQAEWIEKETGVRTVAARDGMVVEVGDSFEVK